MKFSTTFGLACFVTALSNAALAAPIFAPAPPARPHLKAYGDWAAL